MRRFAVAAVLLLPASVPALEETALFRQSATDMLIKKGLEKTDPGTFVCLKIDNKAPNEAELARFRDWGREVGPSQDCKCVSAEPASLCTRAGTSQPACVLDVYDFQFWSFTNAKTTMTVVCGGPRGYGETARFEKRADGWQYIEATRLIKF